MYYTMNNFRKYLPYLLVLTLLTLAIGILYFSYTREAESNILKVVFLDVGQGDAIYIEAPNGRQMLIDGGPGPILLSKLAEVMPFADRSIDMLVVTNPDKDHIAGFVDVLRNYKVTTVIEPGTKKNTLIYKSLKQAILDNNVKLEIARRGMRIILDKEKNIYFDILFPDRDVSNFDSNEGSIVGKLVYGNKSFMLMGDATKYTELLIKNNENPEILHSKVLKLGHHGSRTSSSVLWLEAVNPELAIISAGLNNRYNHPHQDILDRLNSFNIPYFGTYQKGTIIFKTDGVTMSIK